MKVCSVDFWRSKFQIWFRWSVGLWNYVFSRRRCVADVTHAPERCRLRARRGVGKWEKKYDFLQPAKVFTYATAEGNRSFSAELSTCVLEKSVSKFAYTQKSSESTSNYCALWARSESRTLLELWPPAHWSLCLHPTLHPRKNSHLEVQTFLHVPCHRWEAPVNGLENLVLRGYTCTCGLYPRSWQKVHVGPSRFHWL